MYVSCLARLSQIVRCHTFGPTPRKVQSSGRKKAHKHKLFALVNVQMALEQTAACPRVNQAKSLCVRLEAREIQTLPSG